MPHLHTSLPDLSVPQPAPAAPPTAPTARPRTRSAAPLPGSVDEVDSATGTPACGDERAGMGGGHVDAAGAEELARSLAYAQECAAAAAKAERAAALAAAKAVEAQDKSREAEAAHRALLAEGHVMSDGEGGEEAGGAEAEHTTVDIDRLWTAMRAAGVQLPPLSERALERDFSRPAEEWPPPPRSKVRADLLSILTGVVEGVARGLTPKRGGGGVREGGGGRQHLSQSGCMTVSTLGEGEVSVPMREMPR